MFEFRPAKNWRWPSFRAMSWTPSFEIDPNDVIIHWIVDNIVIVFVSLVMTAKVDIAMRLSLGNWQQIGRAMTFCTCC